MHTLQLLGEPCARRHGEFKVGFFFQSYGKDLCCLCGEANVLTGEHKIKASALRDLFGKVALYIGSSGAGDGKSRFVQGPQSKHLKFGARICEACNTTRTQQADREFDCFSKLAHELIQNGDDPATIFDHPRYQIGTEAYLNIFRYFAKLLCCHIADIEAPVPVRLASFAIGRTQKNCVWLAVQSDWTYEQLKAHLGDQHQYAAHGGLIVNGSRKSGDAISFHSTLTIGPVQYVFYFQLASLEKLELRFLFNKFYNRCRLEIEREKNGPLSPQERNAQGLQ